MNAPLSLHNHMPAGMPLPNSIILQRMKAGFLLHLWG